MSYAVTCAKVALVFFCGRNQEEEEEEDGGDTLCGPSSILLVDFLHASTCSNHILVISIDALLLLALSFPLLLHKVSCSSTKGDRDRDRSPLFFNFSPSSRRHGGGGLEISAFAFNACLGLSYLGLGLWVLEERLRMGRGWGFAITPLHWWPLLLAQGFTWILIGLTTTLTTSIPHKRRLLSLFVTAFAAFLCGTSILQVYAQRYMTLKLFLDISSLPGALLFLITSFTTTTNLTPPPHDAAAAAASLLHNPPLNLNGGEYYCDEQDVIRSSGNNEQEDSVTPFANAGFFSKLSFWWMNSVMHKGYEKTIEENDIPKLSEKDLAGSCYSLFLDKLHDQQQKQKQKQKPASILWTIVSCHWRDILVSGIFALLKILMLSAGPLLLKSFINVSSGQGAFRYEGYMLALGLFFAKCLESLSQRQWYFRTRRIGLQVRSLLAAAIFKKQLKLSNSAKMVHSSGEIMNYVTVDAYRIGEFPFWFHQIWTTVLQLCISLVILYQSVGLATIAAFVVILLTVACNSPLAKLQHKYQTRLMDAQDERLKAMSEALVHMKVLKLYAWEAHFMKVIQVLRAVECRWIQAFQLRRAYNSCLFWTSPVLVSAATFSTCYFLHIPLNAGNVFTFVATMRLVQDPVRLIPDVLGVFIQAKVAFTRILKFLDAPELLQNGHFRRKYSAELDHPIRIKSASFSWDEHSLKPTLRNVNLDVKAGEKVAICGEVGSGKSTLLAAILGEVPKTDGTVHVCGKIAYVSQNAWIQTGTVQDNILFGSPMDKQRYRETLERCSLVKDIETLQFGDLTEIGERGVNLSGGQKQRLQLARALYQDADTYLLDDPFSAVDAHTATSLFNEYVMGALSSKTVLLVTHQVDFLPAFSFILLMSDGEVLHAAPYHELLASTKEFQDLVDAHKDSVGSEKLDQLVTQKKDKASIGEIILAKSLKQHKSTEASGVDQLIKKEERETGNTGLKPYLQYLNQDKGLLYASIAALCHVIFVSGQISQNSWMAANVQNPQVSMLKLISVYLTIGFSTTIFLLFRSLFVVVLGMQSSKSLFSQLLHSLFRAPMSFFDSTPLGRILSRVSSDLSIVDLDVPFTLIFTFGSTVNAYSNLGVLTVITWQILFVALPLVYLTIRLQRYYFASAKELMRINGTTRSILANHLSETIAGTTTIRAFEEEDRFFTKNLELIDKNASPFFHNFAANEWLIQRLETVSAAILSSSALVMVLLPPGTFSSGFIGMALSYGLSLNMSLVFSIQNQCTLTNYIISVERLNQYMHVPSEAPEIVDGNRPAPNWPAVGRVELTNLQVRYRPESPLVLREISCTFEGGHKIGIVGRTGSGKTTLIGALFRLVEPVGGKITIDGLDITTIGLHDLRSRLGIIPQEPTLFQGSVRYNLDPLGHYTDQQIWEVLDKCQLREAVLEKENGLDSLVVEDGSNWSMGQRQLFCLGRALLKRSRILVLDEATASIDNATDAILQRTIRTEFAECTVITVAHRIPTVMDCTMVLAISYGKLVEYDEPMKLMNNEESLFGKLVKEYWSHSANPGI